METKIWTVDKNVDINKNNPQLVEAANLLLKNEVVAFPTETVYGLGADATSDAAVAKIFEAKGRPSDNPLIVHISDFEQLEKLAADISDEAVRLIRKFWPGPLTLVLRKREESVSSLVTAGLDTVAIRMPDHPVALALIREAGLPIAAPSANRSGKPSPTSAGHVKNDLDGRIAGIVDGGPTGVGVESTVLDCTTSTPVILRPGGISKEEIEKVIGSIDQDPALRSPESAPRSPGMKYRHYAPSAPLYLVDGDQKWIQTLIDKKRSEGLKVGILAPKESAPQYKADEIVAGGSREDLNTIARSLYRALRELDETPVDIIFAEVYPESGVGSAIMNRLEKAAGHRWIRQRI